MQHTCYLFSTAAWSQILQSYMLLLWLPILCILVSSQGFLFLLVCYKNVCIITTATLLVVNCTRYFLSSYS